VQDPQDPACSSRGGVFFPYSTSRATTHEPLLKTQEPPDSRCAGQTLCAADARDGPKHQAGLHRRAQMGQVRSALQSHALARRARLAALAQRGRRSSAVVWHEFNARRAMMTSSRPSRALPAPHRANEYVASPEEVAMLKESTVRIRRYALGG